MSRNVYFPPGTKRESFHNVVHRPNLIQDLYDDAMQEYIDDIPGNTSSVEEAKKFVNENKYFSNNTTEANKFIKIFDKTLKKYKLRSRMDINGNIGVIPINIHTSGGSKSRTKRNRRRKNKTNRRK